MRTLLCGIAASVSIFALAAPATANAQLVQRTEAGLEKIKNDLDQRAGASQARTTSAPVSADFAGITSWRVDPKSSTVVVTVLKGQKRPAALDRMSKYGSAIQVEETDFEPKPTAFMDGGDPITTAGLLCSAGFNARNAAGQGYLLTAGHCHRMGSGNAIQGQDGTHFGRFVESWFPGPDDAIAINENPAYWAQGPWVDGNPGNGPVHIVRGSRDSGVGTDICKSGRTTKLSCGKITAKNVTVNYPQGVVTGLTQHSACVEGGDSGGANFSGWGNVFAEGITSGAANQPNGRCLGQGTSISFYQPIAPTLAYYGPRYGISLWIA